MIRYENNPVVSPDMVTPTAAGLEVMGAFNAGATVFEEQVLLLIRVAERCKTEPGGVGVPVYHFENGAADTSICVALCTFDQLLTANFA